MFDTVKDAPLGFWVVSAYVIGLCFFLHWAVIAAIVPVYWQVYGRRFLFGRGGDW